MKPVTYPHSPEQSPVWTIDPLSDDRWPAFVDRHPRASVFHSRGWLRTLHATYGYEPVAVTTCAPIEPLTNAVVFCVVRSWLTGDRLVSLPFSDHCEPLVTSPEEFGVLTACVEDMRQIQGWKYVEMRISGAPWKCADRFSQSAVYFLHRLDLRPDLAVLYRGLHHNCIQRKIRRAERERLSYDVGVDESLIDRLYRLLQLTRARHRLPPQPIEWFHNLVAGMGTNLCIRIASKAGEPVAGILTLRHGAVLMYKYGASDTDYAPLGGMAMLLWESIKEAKQAGCEWLDLGRSDLDNPGLIAFKERWGAERAVVTTWQTPPVRTSSRRERLIVQWAKGLFIRLPSPVQTFAGRLLYRHVG